MQCFTAGLALLALTAIAQCSPQFITLHPLLPGRHDFVFPSASGSSSSSSLQTPPSPAFSRIVSNGGNSGRPGLSRPGENRQDFDGDFNRPENTGEDFGEDGPEGQDQNRPSTGEEWDSGLDVSGQNQPHRAENRPIGSAVGTPEIAGQFGQNRPIDEDERVTSPPASGNEFNPPNTLGQGRPASGSEFNPPDTLGQGRPTSGNEFNPPNTLGQGRPASGNEFNPPNNFGQGRPASGNEFNPPNTFGQGRPASGNEFNPPNNFGQGRPASGNEFNPPNTLGQGRPASGNGFNRPDAVGPNTPPLSSNDVNRPNLFDRPHPAFGGNIPFRPDLAFAFGRPPFGFPPPKQPFNGKRPTSPFDSRPAVDCTKTGDTSHPPGHQFNPSRPGPFNPPLFKPNQKPGGTPGGERNDSSAESDEDQSGEESNETSEESAEAGPAESVPNRWGTKGPSTPTTPVAKVTPPCSCAAGPEYNPVCGTDNQTYENPRRLECARVCNRSPGVQLAYHAACLDRPVVPSLSGWGRPPQTPSQSQAQSQSAGRRAHW